MDVSLILGSRFGMHLDSAKKITSRNLTQFLIQFLKGYSCYSL